MNNFTLYLKSHTDVPDFEQTIEAMNENDAMVGFMSMTHGEISEKEIRENMIETSGCCDAPIAMNTFCSWCKEHCK